MSTLDLHLRRVIELAKEKRSQNLVDDAFALIEDGCDRFQNDTFSPEVLVLFAEVASQVRGREEAVSRALELYERLRCEDDQFKVRALLVRCCYEARLGTESCQLKGQHLLQQIRYALSFLLKGLEIAQKPGNDLRYGFLVYNASLVFWEVVRPLCRIGWQSQIVRETDTVLTALRTVVQQSSGAPAPGEKSKGGGGGGGTAIIPTPVDPMWLVEMMLNLAFGQEDAGDLAGLQKTVDAANALMEDTLKQDPPKDMKDQRLKVRELVWNARAHFARKQPDKTRQEIGVASGSAMTGTALFICNGGIPKEKSEAELLTAWKTIDTDFEYPENDKSKEPAAPAKSLDPNKLVELALATRAACASECYVLAQAMLTRLERSFQMPAGRGGILRDLTRAELDVWRSCNSKPEDPATGMLLGPEAQAALEIEARKRGVGLCELCIMAAKRIDDVALVEESAVVMWNLAQELLCGQHRLHIHRSLQNCANILEDVQSVRLVELRVQLHFEVSRCEAAQDLLSKSNNELLRARKIDYTVSQKNLSDAQRQQLADDESLDPAPHVRRFDSAIDEELHLLRLKLNVYEEPDDPVDQVALLLDQVRQQKPNKSGSGMAFSILTQGFAKLDAALDELSDERLEKMSNTVEKEELVVTSEAPLKPLPHEAPASVKEGGVNEQEFGSIRDQRRKTDREQAVAKSKRLVLMMCKIAIEAYKAGQPGFAIRVCDRVLDAVVGNPLNESPPRYQPQGLLVFGPHPVEVEGALLLAETAYTKALSIADQLKEQGFMNGINDEAEVKPPDGSDGNVPDGTERRRSSKQIAREQNAASSLKKKELVQALLFGMELSREFQQWRMVNNGLSHWWNLHRDLVRASHEQPQLLSQQMHEDYLAGLKEIQSYLSGDRSLPTSSFKQQLVVNLVLAFLDASVATGQLSTLDADQLMVLRRLDADERKEVILRLTTLCCSNGRPIPDLAKLRPERLESTPGTETANKKEKPAGKKGDAKSAVAEPSPSSAVEDNTDLKGCEADVAVCIASIPFAKDDADAQQNCVNKAVELLSKWEPSPKDDAALALWVELWTRLGTQCLGQPFTPNVGAKLALMCAIRGLGDVSSPQPKHASQRRLQWRGACHAMCGQAFYALVDKDRQEKDSLESLQCMSVTQFERCCEYAMVTSNEALAMSGATSLWRVALPLLHSAETRASLVMPLRTAVRMLSALKCTQNYSFMVDLYSALFDCYSDRNQWDEIHTMLNESFQAVPSTEQQNQRRLWALRLVALSRQGKNVARAMDKMKENEPRAQSRIWMLLAQVSSKQVEQLNAFGKAIEILEQAQLPDLVELRMQFADWLLRNGFPTSMAQDELSVAADMLLEFDVESEDEEEEEEEADLISRGTAPGGFSPRKGTSPSLRSTRASGASRKALGSTLGPTAGKGRPKNKQPAKEDAGPVSAPLGACHYEALCRVFAAKGRLGSGEDMHLALQTAVHFAVRFFACTVDVVNVLVEEEALAKARQDNERNAQGQIKGDAERNGPLDATGTKTLFGEKSDADAVMRFWPCFSMPTHLADWAFEESWPWWGKPAFTELLARAEELDAFVGGLGASACHPRAFARPAMTFHMLVRLEDDLEEHGYHLWALPILALHMQLASIFSGQEGLHAAITCFVHLRLARFASECLIREAATSAMSKAVQELAQIPGTFSEFEEELESASKQRASHDEDPDWLVGFEGRVATPWSCSVLCAYEVWAALAKECLRHGELWMACKMADAAAHHARKRGDRRTMRDVLLTKAHLAWLEGKPDTVSNILREVTAAEPLQAAEVAVLLADVSKQQQGATDQVLQDVAIQLGKAARIATDEPASLSSCDFTLAECSLQWVQLQDQLARLSSTRLPAHEWTSLLDSAFRLYDEIGARLNHAGCHRRRIALCVGFAEAAIEALDLKRIQVARAKEGEGHLTLDSLLWQSDRLRSVVGACHESRDRLLSLAVPFDSVREGMVLPVQMLVARFDVWASRSSATHRALSLQSVCEGESGKKQKDALNKLGDAEQHSPLHATRALARARCASPDKEPTTKDRADAWLQSAEDRITAEAGARGGARGVGEIEGSVASLSNAVVLLGLKLPEPLPREADGSFDSKGIPSCAVEALVELGRLQLELSMEQPRRQQQQQQRRTGRPGPKWDLPPVDPCELRGMEVAESCSNVLNGREISSIFRASGPSEAGGPDPDYDGAAVDSEETAKSILCSAASLALKVGNLPSARRALQALAFDAYGFECPQAAFEFLILLQSTDVCMQAFNTVSDLLPIDHPERIQIRMLQQLERDWSCPQLLTTYQSTDARLRQESPLVERLQLHMLPSVTEMVLSYLPPLTLVVTMQVHEHYLYVGAVCSPPDGDPGQRQDSLRHFVTCKVLLEQELHECLRRLEELNQQLEKDLVTSLELNEVLTAEHAAVVAKAEAVVIGPIVEELTSHFWRLGIHVEHAQNPRQLLLLPDAALWDLPWERMPSFLQLFSSRHSVISRDYSLHLTAHRIKGFMDEVPKEGASRPLKVPISAVKSTSTTLLSDVFGADSLRDGEDERSETMASLHERLVRDKIIGNEEQSLHGKDHPAAPEDIQVLLADSSALCYMGFGNFFAAIDAGRFASQDLRHLAVLGLFHRNINDQSFRRQAKIRASIPPQHVAARTAYSLSLIAAFRGVACTVLAVAPVPTSINMRCLEVFAREVKDGKTVSQALEKVLTQTTPRLTLRYVRMGEGGVLPEDAMQISGDGQANENGSPVDLLPPHTMAAYSIVGVPWLESSNSDTAAKKK